MKADEATREFAMMTRRWTPSRVLALLFAVGLVSGCANLAPVRSFAGDAKQLSAAFDPLLAGSAASCMDKFIRKQVLTARNFDAADADGRAKELCGPIDTDNALIADLNALLEQYADTLLALADDRLPSYKPELNGLKDAMALLKMPGSNSALVRPADAGAITALAEFLSRIASQHMQRQVIRELLGHEAAINAIAAALGDYARLNYKAWLRDEQRELAILRSSLDDSGTSEPLAANYLKSVLFAEERQMEARAAAADTFVFSAAALQRSNSHLLAKFDHLDDKELLDQLLGFAREVSGLSRQVKNAF